MVAPKRINLPKGWGKNLSVKFSDEQKDRITWLIYRYVERHNFDERKVSFDEVETQLKKIMQAADLLSEGLPFPHSENDTEVQALVEYTLEKHLTSNNLGNKYDTPSVIVHDVSRLRQAAKMALQELASSHANKPAHRPANKNKNWFVYQLGIYFEACGGNFSMPKEPGPKHKFYNFILSVNEVLPAGLQLTDNEIITRSIKLSREHKKRKKTS